MDYTDDSGYTSNDLYDDETGVLDGPTVDPIYVTDKDIYHELNKGPKDNSYYETLYTLTSAINLYKSKNTQKYSQITYKNASKTKEKSNKIFSDSSTNQINNVLVQDTNSPGTNTKQVTSDSNNFKNPKITLSTDKESKNSTGLLSLILEFLQKIFGK